MMSKVQLQQEKQQNQAFTDYLQMLPMKSRTS
jgi:hypothetical protein